MSYTYSVNNSFATGAIAVFNLKETLKTGGWLVKSSSDGTTYNSTGDQIVSGAAGATGLANSNAWFRIQAPGTPHREFTFQRGSNTSWRIKYSTAANFTGGSPGATQTPSATDEQLLLGTGTDAAPSTATWFSADAGYLTHIGVGTGGSDGYGFYIVNLLNGGSNTAGCLVLDPINAGITEDVDQCVLYTGITTGCFTTSILASEGSSGADRVVGWIGKGLTGEGFVSIPANQYFSGGNTVVPGNLGTNPFNSKDDTIPIFFMRRVALVNPVGYKGIGGLMKWVGTTRSIGDTLSTSASGSKDRIIINAVSLPWNGSTPSL
jgi:hypothetical protein